MTREFAFIEMEDDPDTAYVVSIPEHTSARYAEVLLDRFEDMFDESDVTVTADNLSSDTLQIETMDAEDFKQEYMAAGEDDDDD